MASEEAIMVECEYCNDEHDSEHDWLYLVDPIVADDGWIEEGYLAFCHYACLAMWALGVEKKHLREAAG